VQKTDKCLVAFLRKIDGKAGGRGESGDHRYPGGKRLLHYLKRNAPAHDKDRV
jgi:hypothetical protein